MLRKTTVPMEWRVVDRREAERAGVKPALLSDAPAVKDAAALRRVAVWSEESLGDGWIAAYRVAVEGGLPVVAEVRVFPDRWARGARPAGRWAGDYLDSPAVPRGGLSATILRRLKLAEPFRDALGLIQHHRAALPDLFAERGPLQGLEAGRATEGQMRVTDAELRRLARAYVAAGYSAVAVAKRLGLKVSTVRGRILLARRRNILGTTGKRGQRGGALALERRRSR